MLKVRSLLRHLALSALLLVGGLTASVQAATGISPGAEGLIFQTPAEMTGYAIYMSVSGPGNWYFGAAYESGETLSLPAGDGFVDGVYTYELKAQAVASASDKGEETESEYARASDDSVTEGENGRVVSALSTLSSVPSIMPEVASGSFRIVNGALYVPDDSETEAYERSSGESAERVSATSSLLSGLSTRSGSNSRTGSLERSSDSTQTRAQVFVTDLVIQGSECVGTDCVNGESFGADTIRLKENNLRIHFNDTSNSGSFPTNDWRIVINDQSNGGDSYFGIEDSDSGRSVFKIQSGARANSLFISRSNGRVGLGTSSPAVELHVADGDTPTLRLDQDGTAGWPKQIWDVAANETNFFVRDATNSGQLSFRIRAGAPGDSLYIDTDGDVGLGTKTPSAKLHVQGNAYINGNLELASSRELKDHIETLDGVEAVACLKDLTPVSFQYKSAPGETQLGFIAEDVPDMVASNNRKGLNPMDIAALLTRVAQEQQNLLGEQRREIESQRSRIEDLQNRLAALEARLAQ